MDFKLYTDAFLKPKETFAAQKANAELGKGILNFVLGGFLYGIVAFVLVAALSLAGGNPAGIVVGAIYIVAAPILVVIFELIMLIVPFILSKIVGGTGSYTSLFYLTSLYSVAALVLQAIPLVGFFVSLYTVYLFYLAVKESQGLSQNRALAVVLIPLVLVIVVVVLLLVLGLFALGGVVSSAAAPKVYPY